MKRAEVNQSELARRLGIQSQAVNQWLKPGGTTPRGRRLFEVANALGIELSQLLGESPGPIKSSASVTAQARAEWVAAFDATHPEDQVTLARIARGFRRDNRRPDDPPPDGPRRTPPRHNGASRRAGD
jgi:transcriptional regulator with XRE-family HTH domain